MAMRMSGLMSGMDTESIIQQLVEARSTKVTTAKKAQTKLSWKQDAWKELNTKLKNLQSKYLSSMRLSTAYTKKVTKVSNPNAVSVITGENAVNGVQELTIDKLAKTAYLTGGEVTMGGQSKTATALTEISELDGWSGEGKINVSTGNTSVDINITEKTTISDVLSQLKDAGLNASFDAKWGRFSVSAKNSGAASDFSITALNKGGADALSAMQLQVDLKKDEYTRAEYEKYAKYFEAGNKTATLDNMRDMINADVASRTDAYLNQYKSLMASQKTANGAINDLKGKYKDNADMLNALGAYTTATANAISEKRAKIDEINRELNAADSTLTETEKEAKKNEIETLQKEIDDLGYTKKIADKTKEIEELNGKLSAADSNLSDDDRKTMLENVEKLRVEIADLQSMAANTDTVASLQKQIDTISNDTDGYIKVNVSGQDEEGNDIYTATASTKLTGEVEDRYYAKAEWAAKVMADYNTATAADGDEVKTGATKVSGRDATITLNGATYTNSNNTFEINGLTFTALAETDASAPITVTTEQDVDGIYDMVKNFLKEYNSIINEMDKLYNAESASGYEPLTDDEKDAMSEKDIEKYEQKIKDSLLRRDENLSNISSGLKSIMSAGIDVNGRTLHLYDFGIETLGYFTAADNEKNAYHIAGDADDAYTSGDDDKLKTMIANDPDTVISFFTKLSQNLYGKMTDLSKSVNGYRSFGNFYDDKKMKSDYDDYTTKIADLEEKLNDYEDSWYKKFSAMETAMAKMQQNANAVTALLGGG